MSASTSSLRDHLLASLATLPNPHQLDLTVLSSEPKRTTSIFPHTPIPPKCFQQEFLVTLSSDLPPSSQSNIDSETNTTSNGPITSSDVSSTSGLQDGSSTLPKSEQGGSVQPGADGKRKPASGPEAGDSSTSEPNAARATTKKVLVSAISAYLYTFPHPNINVPSASPSNTTQSPSKVRRPSGILYISKLDSSGYSPTPLPLTRALITSFLDYFLSLESFDEMRIQLFARAQRQYLFPNSADGGGKKVLSGSGLSRWWKGVYEDVVSQRHVRMRTAFRGGSRHDQGIVGEETKTNEQVRLRYLLPGYDEIEARNILGPGKGLPEGIKWTYEPPFVTTLNSISIPSISSSTHAAGNGPVSSNNTNADTTKPFNSKDTLPPSLAMLIPSLPDDPKTRFLEELVTDALSTGNPHLKRLNEGSRNQSQNGSQNQQGSEHKKEKGKERKTRKEREMEEEERIRTEAHLTLSRVDKGEFWERIGFRQECSSGDVTGFFTLELTRNGRGNGHEQKQVVPSAQGQERKGYPPNGDGGSDEPATVGPNMDSTSGAILAPKEFTTLDPESAKVPNDTGTSTTTYTLSTMSKPGTDGSQTAIVQEQSQPTASTVPTSEVSTTAATTNTQPGNLSLRQEILDRLLTALINVDFGTLDLAIEATEIWLKQASSIVKGEIGDRGWNECLGSIEKKAPANTNTGPGTVTSGGSDSGRAMGVGVDKRKAEEVITMLQPRKKKKPLK